MLFINIWDGLTAPCLVYNTATYTVYGRCDQYGWCMFIHWPVRLVHGLYGPVKFGVEAVASVSQAQVSGVLSFSALTSGQG